MKHLLLFLITALFTGFSFAASANDPACLESSRNMYNGNYTFCRREFIDPDLASAVRRASIFIEERANEVRLRVCSRMYSQWIFGYANQTVMTIDGAEVVEVRRVYHCSVAW
ncbi:MAG: hypothetical protein V4692_12740 [Bdellovibrionota bacterium]